MRIVDLILRQMRFPNSIPCASSNSPKVPLISLGQIRSSVYDIGEESQKFRQHQKKMKYKAQIYKKTVQYSEMKECSFKPKIKDNKIQRQQINSQKSLQDVAGFKKFYQNIEKAVAKQQRKKELQQKLLPLQKNYDRRRNKITTIDRANAFFTEYK